MTRTRKVRRRFVAEKYAAVIDAFYGGRDEVELATTITYEDGRQATIQSRVRIEDVERSARPCLTSSDSSCSCCPTASSSGSCTR